MKPVIGITSDYSPPKNQSGMQEEETYFLRARYVRAIDDLGGIPLILPPVDRVSLQNQLLGSIDGLLVTGSGLDLDPRIYGETKKIAFEMMDPMRAGFELSCIRQAVKKNLPVFAICGGVQALNVAMGGGLIQDISRQIPHALSHQQKGRATKTSHSIKIIKESRLGRILRRTSLRVNSYHHQSPHRLGKGLIINAIASDGVIEGLEREGSRFIIGVQWHPEYLYKKNDTSRRLFHAFINAAAADHK